MKTRIFFFILAFYAMALPGLAQKYLNVYQDNIVIKRIPTSSIDSISVTSSNPRTIEMWNDGSVFLSYATEEIDSIKVTSSDEPFSYIGIVGFNDELYKKEIGVLSTSTMGQYKSFVNELSQKDGTLLYFAVDDALDMLEKYKFKTPIKSVNFITFTDGLDLGSTMMNNTYWTSNDYLNAMNQRITGTHIQGIPINAFTVGLRGRDVSDVELFNKNLVSLASNEENAFEVSNIYEFRSRLQEIANRIINITNRQTVSVKVPGIDDGALMRFVLDGQSFEESQFYIEGSFSMLDRSLHDVSYHGMHARSGSVVQGTQDGIFLTFTFRGLQRSDGDGLIPLNNIKHYYQLPTGSWQINSEFRPDNNTLRVVTYMGTSIILVLDCSNSLGNDINKMKNYANEFIDMVAGKALPVTLDIPQNVSAGISEQDERLAVHLEWDIVRFAENYDIYRSNNSYGGFTIIASDVSSTDFTDERPLEGNNYYQIVAKGHGLTSNCSANAYIDVSLDIPQNIRAALDDSRFVINVSWETVKYAESYNIYRNGSLVAEGIKSPHWIDESPRPGNNYYYVKAIGHGLISAQSENTDNVDYSLDMPQNIRVVMDDNIFIVNVSWDAVKYAEYYKVYRSSCNLSSYFSLVADSVYSLSWSDQAPLRGDNYYRIIAINKNTTSLVSDISDVVKYELTAPQNVKASLDDNDLLVNVSWDAVKYANFYKIYRICGDSSSKIIHSKIKGIKHDYSESSINSYNSKPTNTLNINYQNNYAEYLSVLGLKYDIDYPSNCCVPVFSGKVIVSNKGSADYDGEIVIHIYYNEESRWGNYNYLKEICLNAFVSAGRTADIPFNIDGLTPGIYYWPVVSVNEISIGNEGDYIRRYDPNIQILVADSIYFNSWQDKSPFKGDNSYRIYAVYKDLISPISEISNVVECELGVPQNVKAILDDNELAINLTWDAVKYAKSYIVYRNGTQIAKDITTPYWTDVSPSTLDSNIYSVKAVCHDFTSDASSNTEPINLELSAPQNVQASLDDNVFAINITWDVVKFAESYIIYRNGSLVAKGITSTHWTDNSPSPSDSNSYSVKAEGHGLTSISSKKTEPLYFNLPAPPNVKAGLDDEEFVIKVTWDAVKFAEYYKIYRSSSSSGSYSLVADSVKSSSWKDKQPLSGNNYYHVLAVAYGQLGSYATSNVARYEMPAPQNVSAVKGEGQFTINITWDSVKYADYYQVYRGNSETGTFALVADNVKTNSWTDQEAVYDIKYYKICAVGYGFTSALSTIPAIISLFPLKKVFTVNGVSFTMIKVDGGTFLMGATEEQGNDAYDYEKPVHQVSLSDFYIGETEVTQGLWKAVMGSYSLYNYSDSDQMPSDWIGWDECQTFITRLNELTGQKFRLPSEAEWEFAARGGNASHSYKYSGSNHIDDVAWMENGRVDWRKHIVATKAPNELGIYDMSGNVCEWCQDWFGYYSSEAQTNPTGPTSGERHVSRGGRIGEEPRYCRVTNRTRIGPIYEGDGDGFRLALSVAE